MMGVPSWPFGPLYLSSRRPLVAPLTRETGSNIALYCTKAEMPEIGILGARAPKKEADVDNARKRGFKTQQVAPKRAPPISHAGSGAQARRRRRHFELELELELEVNYLSLAL